MKSYQKKISIKLAHKNEEPAKALKTSMTTISSFLTTRTIFAMNLTTKVNNKKVK